jgi:hypothetical protein
MVRLSRVLRDATHLWCSLQSLPSTVLRRVMREITEMKKSPPEGIRLQTSEEDMLDVTGIIQGPGKLLELGCALEDASPFPLSGISPVAQRAPHMPGAISE